MIDKRIGNRIKQCRERAGLSQEELSAKTGISINHISGIERGASFPRYENLILILNTIGASADEIFCDVIVHSSINRIDYYLSEKLKQLSDPARFRISTVVEFMIDREILTSNFKWEK